MQSSYAQESEAETSDHASDEWATADVAGQIPGQSRERGDEQDAPDQRADLTPSRNHDHGGYGDLQPPVDASDGPWPRAVRFACTSPGATS